MPKVEVKHEIYERYSIAQSTIICENKYDFIKNRN